MGVALLFICFVSSVILHLWSFWLKDWPVQAILGLQVSNTDAASPMITLSEVLSAWGIKKSVPGPLEVPGQKYVPGHSSIFSWYLVIYHTLHFSLSLNFSPTTVLHFSLAFVIVISCSLCPLHFSLAIVICISHYLCPHFSLAFVIFISHWPVSLSFLTRTSHQLLSLARQLLTKISHQDSLEQ